MPHDPPGKDISNIANFGDCAAVHSSLPYIDWNICGIGDDR